MSTRLVRIMRIDQRIREGSYPSAASLAADLEVSERTIYGDRDYLINQLNAPLAFDEDAGGWHYTDQTYVLPAIFTSEGDLLAFFLGQLLADQYLGTPFEVPLRSALDKLSRYLPDSVRLNLAEASQHFTVSAGATIDLNDQLMLDLEKAIRQRQQVLITYYTASRGAESQRTVDPYHLYNARGDWYLLAHDHRRKEVRNFHIGRIRQWHVLEATFERDPNFNPETYLGRGFLTEHGEVHDIVIRFDSYQARWIRERQWHTSQRIEEQPDGGLILHMHCAGQEEIKRWVMSYGSHAEVLKPDSLRQAIIDEMKGMGEVYQE
jgi:predicted DNA-binding transcriptional regulator YafY